MPTRAVICALLLAGLIAPATAPGAATFVSDFGTAGQLGGQFSEPRDLDVERNPPHRLFIADHGNKRVQRFDADGAFQRTWGFDVAQPAGNDAFETCTDAAQCKTGTAAGGLDNGELDLPWAIGLGPTGEVFVADVGFDWITRFNDDGVYISRWSHADVRGLGTDAVGEVYAGDGDNVTRTSAAGGAEENLITGVTDVRDVEVDDDADIVYVVDQTAVKTFDKDGDPIATIGAAQLDDPTAVAVRGTELLVGDSGLRRVCRFTTAGVFVECFGTSSGDPANPPPGFFPVCCIRGLGFASDGDLYVLSSAESGGRPRVQRFEITNTPANDDDDDDDNGGGGGGGGGGGQNPGPQPTPPPPSPSPVPPAPVTILARALPRASSVIGLPSARRCVRGRRLRLSFKEPAGFDIARAVIKVTGKRAQTVRGAALSRPVNLRSLPKARFSVDVAVTFTDGRALQAKRSYRGCKAKRRRA